MNAKVEFIEHVKDREIKCASLYYEVNYDKTNPYDLPVNYNAKQFSDFMESLSFEYYEGYGGQDLFGIIWYKDGTWSERGEYDGSEWWEYKSLPEIPEGLL